MGARMMGGFQYCFLDGMIETEDTILEIREHALKLYREGVTILKWEGEGTSAERKFVAPVESILQETRHALKSRWPHKYGHIVRSSQMIRCG